MQKLGHGLLLNTLLCGLLTLPLTVGANTAARQDVQAFIERIADTHKFERGELQRVFEQVEIRPEIIDAMNRPYEAKPWHQYRPLFVTQARMDEGAEFLRQHHSVLQRAESKYGVPAEIITAILGVETRYGRYRGKYRVADALATLGFDYPRRSTFFLKELEAFLLLSREERFDPLAVTGSYAGAMGKPQFISSSYRHYAVDFDGDGIRDLLDNSADAIGSVANYLARHGWQRNQPVAVPVLPGAGAPTENGRLKKPDTAIQQWRQRGYTPEHSVSEQWEADLIVLQSKTGPEYWLGLRNFYAITRYNHSELYAMAVYQLSQGIKRQLQAQANIDQ
jgi:membrane-bound lytic murein transglycosylase B